MTSRLRTFRTALSLFAVFAQAGLAPTDASARAAGGNAEELVAVRRGTIVARAKAEGAGADAVTWNLGRAVRVPAKGLAIVVNVPERLRLVGGKFDLVIHFHGAPHIQERNVERAELGAVVVGVNAGVVSGHYEKAYAAPGAFEALKAAARDAVASTGRVATPHIGRIAISTWSAGFGGVAAMAHEPGSRVLDEVDALLIADGVFAQWEKKSPRHVRWASLDFLLSFAERARKGEKLLAITHTEIPTQGYPSMPEIMDAFARELHLPQSEAPRGDGGVPAFPARYRTHDGSLWITGHRGKTFDAHIDQLGHMADTMLPFLRNRWHT